MNDSGQQSLGFVLGETYQWFDAAFKELAAKGEVLLGGLAIIAGVSMLCWFVFQALSIITGKISQPLADLLRNGLYKLAIFVFAGALTIGGNSAGPTPSSDWQVSNVLIETSSELVKTVAGAETPFNALDNHINNMFEKTNSIMENKAKRHAWEIIDKTADMMGQIWLSIKFLIVWIGLLILGAVTFVILLTNNICFMISVAFAPLFIFFLAFETTKGWFNSWLNTVMGYGFTLTVITFTEVNMLKIFEKFIVGKFTVFGAGNPEVPGFMECILYCFLCILFSGVLFVLTRLASNWFGGAQNLSSGVYHGGAKAANMGASATGKGASGLMAAIKKRIGIGGK